MEERLGRNWAMLSLCGIAAGMILAPAVLALAFLALVGGALVGTWSWAIGEAQRRRKAACHEPTWPDTRAIRLLSPLVSGKRSVTGNPRPYERGKGPPPVSGPRDCDARSYNSPEGSRSQKASVDNPRERTASTYGDRFAAVTRGTHQFDLRLYTRWGEM